MAEARYDICIVGGSIAGATLACHLVREGFSVCLFERRSSEQRKLCAELAHVNLLEQIRKLTGCELGKAVSAELDRVVVHVGARRLERRFELGKGITVERLVLEGALLERASSLGLSLFRPEAILDVELGDGAVTIKSACREVRAGLVVGADGAASVVARRLSRPWRKDELGATRHVRLTVPEGRASKIVSSAARFDILEEGAGYGWLVPYEGELGLGVGALSGAVVDEAFEALLRRHGSLIGEELVAEARRSVRGAPIPVKGPARPSWGRRHLLVGDAAGFVSPASGEGMSLAVASVEAAASAIKLSFASGRLVSRRLERYERLWRAAMPSFSELERLRDELAGEGMSSYLSACANDVERLLLLAPLVGSAEAGPPAMVLLDRLRTRIVSRSRAERGE